MRTFFALELDAETALAVASWRDRQLSPAGRPVPPANFHITLAFIGQLRESELEQLCLSVDRRLAQNRLRGARLTLDCTGYWHKPGIYWLGPQHWPQQFSDLARTLGGISARAGGKRESKTLQPHITLFRRCSAAPPAPAQPPRFTLTYRHFTLFESRQGKRGVSYHPLQGWDLAGPPGEDSG